MKKKLFTFLSVVLLFTLASCDFSKNTDESIKNEGYDHVVTFDANGGKIGNYDVRRIYCKEDSYIFPPGENNLIAPTMLGFTLTGWYTKNGKDTGDWGEKFDFATMKVQEHAMTLYAKWDKYYTVEILYGDNFNRSLSIQNESPDTVVEMPANAPAWKGYTFFGYYEDENFTKEYTWGGVPAYSQDDERVCKVYAKYKKGDYIFVRSAEDFKSLKSTTSVYLMNDIDLGGATISFPKEYTGTIEGNGYTISNFKVEYEQKGVTDNAFGLFTKLRNANFINVTFKDVLVTATVGNNSINQYYAGILAGTAETTQATNLVLENIRIEITLDGVSEDKFYVTYPIGKRDDNSSTDIQLYNTEVIFK